MQDQKIEKYIDEIYEIYRGMRDLNDELGTRMVELTYSNKTNSKKLETMLNEARVELQEYQKTTKSIHENFEIMKGYLSMFIVYGIIFILAFAVLFFFYFKSFKAEMKSTIKETRTLHEQIKYITIDQYYILKEMESDQKNNKIKK